MISISMFGPFEIRTDDRVLGTREFRGRKPRQLLAMLALARGRAVPKAVLADRLWPDSAPSKWSATFDTYVAVLRRALEPPSPGALPVVQTTGGGYRLDTDRVVLDLDVFDRFVGEASICQDDAALRLLERAVEIAGGDVLSDEPYADWPVRDRDVYRRRVIDAAVAGARAGLRCGEPLRAAALARAATERDPLAETAWEVLMEAHHRLGDRVEVIRAYQACKAELEKELGLMPSIATRQLLRAAMSTRDSSPLSDSELAVS